MSGLTLKLNTMIPQWPIGIRLKTYTALFQQSGTSAPIVTPLQNTIGDIVWTRNIAGDYRGTLNGAFPAGKTWIAGGGTTNGNCFTFIPIGDVEFGGYYGITRATDNLIILQVFNTSFLNVDLSTLASAITLYLPEIRVYETI